jgi:hypothetical protein
VVEVARDGGLEPVEQVLATGDLDGRPPLSNGHRCRMYRWREWEALLRRHSCTLVAASAANYLVVQNEAAVEAIAGDPLLWEAFLRWEVECCRELGALDSGTHILTVVQRA